MAQGQSLDADTKGIHSNPLYLTPNLDRWALTGAAHSFTCQPVYGPARAFFRQ